MLLNGINNDAISKQIYICKERHQNDRAISDSWQAAEGINLQFCSLTAHPNLRETLSNDKLSYEGIDDDWV